MRRMECCIAYFSLFNFIASQWYPIVSCFTLVPCRRKIRLPSNDSIQCSSQLQLQINHSPLEDGSIGRADNNIHTIPTSGAVSRSTFLAILLVTAPTSAAAESVDSVSTKRSSVKVASSTTQQESISGFVAGAALTLTKTIVKYPMDTATVRLQMPNTTYTRRQPWRLWDDAYVGITAPLLANVPAGAVFFAVKDAVQQYLKSIASSSVTSMDAITALCSNRVVRTCVAVAVAQIPYWIVRNPSEVVKTRKQSGLYTQEENDSAMLPSIGRLVSLSSNTSETSTTSSIANGFSGWYTGYWENVVYAYPADVLKFVCYEQLSVLFGLDQSALHPAEGALYGAIATASAQWITTPLDVVRNRVMAQGNVQEISNSTNDVNSWNHNETTAVSFWRTYANSLWRLGRDEGLDGLFAGATPRIIKAFISGAIQFATYEETKQAIASFFTRG